MGAQEPEAGGRGRARSAAAGQNGQGRPGAAQTQTKLKQTKHRAVSRRLHMRSSRAVCLVSSGYCVLSQVTQACDQWTKKTEGYSVRDETEVGSYLELRNSSSQ